MARGAAATISAYRGRNRIQRIGKPRRNNVTTQNATLRIKGAPFFRSEATEGLGGGVNISGYLRGVRS